MYVALLRGVNVGGKNKLPMKDLAELFIEAGCTGVRTFIQSGNVLFSASPALAATIPSMIASGIQARFGMRSPVVVRSDKELAAVVRGNPFSDKPGFPESAHVLFLADAPDAGRIASLDPDRSPPDEFSVIGGDVYLWLPNGVANSKLTNAYIDSKLGTVSTGRNWRTVTKLLELMGSERV